MWEPQRYFLLSVSAAVILIFDEDGTSLYQRCSWCASIPRIVIIETVEKSEA